MIGVTVAGSSASTSLTVVNTPSGPNVSVQPTDPATGTAPVSLSFANVTQAGITSLVVGGGGPASPPNFQLGNPPLHYQLTTTATFSGPIQVCIDYTGITFFGTPQLFHDEGGTWVDRTTSVDLVNHVVCGSVSSLSPFALFQPADATPPEIRSVRAEPRVLWPPNHKLVPVAVTVDVADDRDPSPACRIVAVSSNEPVRGRGDGRRAPDWLITGDLDLMLRAERAAHGGRRVYEITVRCTDDSGKAALGTTRVKVAKR